MSFSTRLKELRKEKNCTQRQLGKELGLTANSICEWEKNRSEPSIEMILRLTQFFDVSTDYLLRQTDELGAVLPGSKELPEEELELLRLYRNLPPEFKQSLLSSARLWAGEPAPSAEKKKA